MATSVQRASQLTMADLKGRVDPDWCPGCGDFGVLAAMQKANSTDPGKYLPELAKISYDGVTAKIEFDEHGDTKNGAITLYQVKDGKLVPMAVNVGGKTEKIEVAAAAPAAAAPSGEPKKGEMKKEEEFLRSKGTVARYTVEKGQPHRLETLAGVNAARLFDGFEEAKKGCSL